MKKVLLLLSFIPLGMFAQEKVQDTVQMNEVVIDAGKTNQKIQKAPISVTALKAKEIEVLKIDNLTNLNGFVPNLFMPEHGTRLNTDIYIRGIGVSKGDPSVGVYVDDIPYFDSGVVNFELNDVKKIEVLRGPQGTLYGRNTMGGLIKVYTQEPTTTKTKGFLKLDYGNYNQQKAGAGLNVPVTDKLAVSLDGVYAHKDGFFTNVYDGSNPDEMDTYGARFKLAYKISDKLKMHFLLSYEDDYQNGFPYAVYDVDTQTTEDINYNDPSLYERDFLSSGLFFNYEGEKFDVSFAGSYQNLDDNYEIDQDFLPVSVYFVDVERDNDSYVQEINFKSKPDSKVKWISGIYSLQRSLYKYTLVDLTLSSGVMSLIKTYDQDVDGGALFGQVEIPFGKLALTTGLRWDMEKSRMDYNYDLVLGGNTYHRDDFIHYLSYEQLLPKVALSYYANDDISVYAGVTKGYKAGGFNSTIEREEDETFDPEYSWNYEAGIKTNFLDRHLTANLSLFYIDWEDQQVVQTVPSGRGIMIKNAGESYSKGVEFEGMYHISNLSIGASFGYTDAEFEDYVKDDENDYSGNELPLVPKYTLGFVANYKQSLNSDKIKYILYNVNYKQFGEFYWDVDNIAYQDDYGLLNASISVALPKNLSVGVWGKNLLDADYNRYYFTISTLNKAYVEPARPMQFGGFVKFKF